MVFLGLYTKSEAKPLSALRLPRPLPFLQADNQLDMSAELGLGKQDRLGLHHETKPSLLIYLMHRPKTVPSNH